MDFLATHVVSESEREALLIEAFALVDPRLYRLCKNTLFARFFPCQGAPITICGAGTCRLSAHPDFANKVRS